MTSPFASRFKAVGLSLGWRHNAESVTYTRGADTATLTAIAESANQNVDQFREGQSLGPKRKEWLIRQADLVAVGMYPPGKDDLIQRVVNGRRETWVAFADQGLREWDFEGSGHDLIRIRTKLQKDELA